MFEKDEELDEASAKGSYLDDMKSYYRKGMAEDFKKKHAPPPPAPEAEELPLDAESLEGAPAPLELTPEVIDQLIAALEAAKANVSHEATESSPDDLAEA